MKIRDYMDAFTESARENPRKIEIPNIGEISRRAALGESWAKLAFETGTNPRTVALRVREYRYANFATDAVLEDVRLERDSGKDWLDLATRSGWPIDRDVMVKFAAEFNRLMNAKLMVSASKKKKKKRGGGGGRPKKVLSASVYEDYCAGRKTISEIAEDNGMSVVTARKRLRELAGPDVTDLKSVVRKSPIMDPEDAENIVESLVDDLEDAAESGDIVGYTNIPKGYYDREEILTFLYDEDTEKEEVMRAYGLTSEDLDILAAIDLYPGGRIRELEVYISDASGVIDAASVESVPDVHTPYGLRARPTKLPAIPAQKVKSEPATIASALPYFEPKASPEKKRRGRKKKVYNFTDDEREYIRQSYYDDRKYLWLIADTLTKQRGETVTQTAVKEVVADYSQGRGRRSNLDKAALERDAKRNLAVSTLAEMHSVSAPTIVKALREMGIQPIYSLDKEARLRKYSEKEIAEHQRVLAEVQLQVDAVLSDPARREALKDAYLRSNLATENDVAVLGASEGLSTYNMARVLTDIFDDEIQRLRRRDRIAELEAEYGAENLSKIQRDLIDRRTLRLRGNPFDETALSMYVVPGAQGAAAGLVADQMIRYFHPEASQNKRNLTSGAIVAGVCAADYMYERDEKKIWRAAGGVAGVLISRLIESKFQTRG